MAPCDHLADGLASGVAQLTSPTPGSEIAKRRYFFFGRVFDWPGCARKGRQRSAKDGAGIRVELSGFF